MKACWSKFLELILLKIIDCYKISKEVSREIDTIVDNRKVEVVVVVVVFVVFSRAAEINNSITRATECGVT
uniref:Putative secreted protein n=1 Tax=Anopheles darlingi TaxID=43151 RepID=A0A2M4DQH0_ANODA